MDEDKRPDFSLVPPVGKKDKKRFFPKGISHLEVADPTKECVTVIVYVERLHEVFEIPMAQSPLTGKIKKIHNSSWLEFGIEKDISRVRNSAITMAKREHKQRVLKYATLDLFDTK